MSTPRHMETETGVEKSQQSIGDEELDRKREKAMNKERVERMKKDTDRLLQLATELKEYVDRTNENVLSLEVIKKTEQIEKLAKSIRERMKRDYSIAEPGSLH